MSSKPSQPPSFSPFFCTLDLMLESMISHRLVFTSVPPFFIEERTSPDRQPFVTRPLRRFGSHRETNVTHLTPRNILIKYPESGILTKPFTPPWL